MKRELFQKELVERWMLAPNELLLLMNKMPERARSIGVRSRTLPNTPQGTVVKVSLPGAGACQNPVYSFIHSVWRRMSGREREAGSLVLTSLAKTEVLP